MIALPYLQTSRARIRLADTSDALKLLQFRVENRAHLAPWEPLRESEYYTLTHCVKSIEDGRENANLDRGYPLIAFDVDEETVLATFTFANVVRGAFQACHLGYGVAERMQGQGLMREVLEPGIAWAFGELGLHRVMANYLPRNERSARLLAQLGFEREGYAKRYLQIAGVWEDHVLTALVRSDD
ncbi:GNAT family N-acetyltransferase [Dyella psychrodurans]|uniref:GNAT family N-acetyltransferase n=1 Tax=Dyella psychrodurans TaxID=1927960 RepID=A0A370XB65_9GAMM|nr:GNAT family N-acetyltransferase [Dyella psychrodurans]RDS85542.1 GNAT family N-acetyltransferase [Dyella psychrodurans]